MKCSGWPGCCGRRRLNSGLASGQEAQVSSGSRSLREAKQVSEAAGLDVGPGVGPAARGMAPLVALACGDEGGAGGVAVEDPGDVLRLSGEALPVVGEVDLQRVEGEVRVGQVSSCSGTCPGWRPAPQCRPRAAPRSRAPCSGGRHWRSCPRGRCRPSARGSLRFVVVVLQGSAGRSLRPSSRLAGGGSPPACAAPPTAKLLQAQQQRVA